MSSPSPKCAPMNRGFMQTSDSQNHEALCLYLLEF